MDNDPWFEASPQASPTNTPSHSQQQQYSFNSPAGNQQYVQQRAMNNVNANQQYMQPHSAGSGGGNPSYGGPSGMMSSSMNMSNAQYGEDFENEPPLLEELGINFDHIWTKTQAVVNPNTVLDEHVLDDADLAGPLFFCLLLGACLLLSGKIHFGYIYGFSVFGCAGIHTLLDLMQQGEGIDIYRTCSVLGYCLLPVIPLAVISIVISLRGVFGALLSIVVIGWCTFTSTKMFDAKLRLKDQLWLVGYPVMLFYSCFVLITIV